MYLRINVLFVAKQTIPNFHRHSNFNLSRKSVVNLIRRPVLSSLSLFLLLLLLLLFYSHKVLKATEEAEL